MFRYVALAWDSHDGSSSDAARFLIRRIRSNEAQWQCVFDEQGLTVFCAGIRKGSSEPHPLSGGAGVVLGTVFTRIEDCDSVPCKAVFGPRDTERIRATKGRDLVELYWGRYIAFVRDAARATTWVIRSPCGELDCLTAKFRGVCLYFSCMEDCPALELSPFSINWDYVAAHLCAKLYETRDTGLREVTRVLRGECIELHGPDVTRRFYWQPAQIAERRIMDDVPEVANVLRDTAKACVHAWASCHSGIVQLLSGGLDSSVVLGCLQDAPSRPGVTALNLRNRLEPATDERVFARLAAQRAGCALIEREHEILFSFEGRLRMPRLDSPLGNFYLFAPDNAIPEAVAQAAGATALFSGEGGDQLFYQIGARYACRDSFLRRGLRAATLRFALDAARLEGDTLWGILFRNRSAPAARVLADVESCALLTEEAKESTVRNAIAIHPWLELADNLPPGKWWHVYCLSSAAAGTLCNPLRPDSSTEHVAALISQPLVEVCLRIPTYLLMTGGRYRGLARLAFEPDVPQEILGRTSKASTYDSVKLLLARNLDFVRTTLLDGALVRERLLDRQVLEQALSGQATRLAVHAGQLLTCLICEAWLGSWHTLSQEVAA